MAAVELMLPTADRSNTGVYGGATTAPATMEATSERSRLSLPWLAPRWTRSVSNTTKVSLDGSIHILVPVKPVWPNDPTGKRSPRLLEYEVLMSHPIPRISEGGNEPALIIRSTV